MVQNKLFEKESRGANSLVTLLVLEFDRERGLRLVVAFQYKAAIVLRHETHCQENESNQHESTKSSYSQVFQNIKR